MLRERDYSCDLCFDGGYVLCLDSNGQEYATACPGRGGTHRCQHGDDQERVRFTSGRTEEERILTREAALRHRAKFGRVLEPNPPEMYENLNRLPQDRVRLSAPPFEEGKGWAWIMARLKGKPDPEPGSLGAIILESAGDHFARKVREAEEHRRPE